MMSRDVISSPVEHALAASLGDSPVHHGIVQCEQLERLRMCMRVVHMHRRVRVRERTRMRVRAHIRVRVRMRMRMHVHA